MGGTEGHPKKDPESRREEGTLDTLIRREREREREREGGREGGRQGRRDRNEGRRRGYEILAWCPSKHVRWL